MKLFSDEVEEAIRQIALALQERYKQGDKDYPALTITPWGANLKIEQLKETLHVL